MLSVSSRFEQKNSVASIRTWTIRLAFSLSLRTAGIIPVSVMLWIMGNGGNSWTRRPASLAAAARRGCMKHASAAPSSTASNGPFRAGAEGPLDRPSTQSTWAISTPCMLRNRSRVPGACATGLPSGPHNGSPTTRRPVSIGSDVISCVVASHRLS